jgi:hypothetical protein
MMKTRWGCISFYLICLYPLDCKISKKINNNKCFITSFFNIKSRVTGVIMFASAKAPRQDIKVCYSFRTLSLPLSQSFSLSPGYQGFVFIKPGKAAHGDA